MDLGQGIIIDIIPFWAWFLILTRCVGMVETLPGVGTMQVPVTFRVALCLCISFCLSFGGATAQLPANLGEAILMIGTEFLFGMIVGIIPSLVISGVGVAGQVTTGAIGLGQANMIDPSLGTSVAILARLQMMIGVMVFLLINGHHSVIRAVSGLLGTAELGMFRPNMDTFNIMLERFSSSFELAVMVSAPILVTILVTNFVLGLITKFVPQVNIFIISLPLTIIVGLYISAFTLIGLSDHIVELLHESEFVILRLATFK